MMESGKHGVMGDPNKLRLLAARVLGSAINEDTAAKQTSAGDAMMAAIINRKGPPTVGEALRKGYMRATVAPFIVITLAFFACICALEVLSLSTVNGQMKEQAHGTLNILGSTTAASIDRMFRNAESTLGTAADVLLDALRTSRTPTPSELSRYGWASYADWPPVFGTLSGTGSSSSACIAGANASESAAARDVLWRTAAVDVFWEAVTFVNTNYFSISFWSSAELGSVVRTMPYRADQCRHAESWESTAAYAAASANDTHGGFVWTEPHNDPAYNGWVATCVYPLFDGEAMAGVVGLQFIAPSLSAVVGDFEASLDGYALLISRTGSLLSCSRDTPDPWASLLLSLGSVFGPGLLDGSRFAEPHENGTFSLEMRGTTTMVSWARLRSSGLIVVVMVDRDNLLSAVDKATSIQAIAVVLTGAVVVAALAVAGLLARLQFVRLKNSIVRPLESIQDSLAKLGDGAFTVKLAAMPLQELQETADIVRRIGGMLDKSFRQLLCMQRAMGVFVPKPFMELLGISETTALALNQCRTWERMTVLVIDIRSFVSIVEPLPLSCLFEFLNMYLSYVVPEIEKCRGFVEKYVGDAIIALFPMGPADAVDSALNVCQAVDRYNAEHTAEMPFVRIGVGVDTGPVVLGTIGAQNRIQVSVIGDVVTVAGRIEALTRKFDVLGLVSGDVAAAWLRRQEQRRVESPFEQGARSPFVRDVGDVEVKGRPEPVNVWELVPGEHPAYEAKQANAAAVARAVGQFRRGSFSKCEQELAGLGAPDSVVGLYQGECKKRKDSTLSLAEQSSFVIISDKTK
eukprot:m51a1_g8428 putative adenylate guanylate cyclase (802) ;mRNA; r:341359-344253